MPAAAAEAGRNTRVVCALPVRRTGRRGVAYDLKMELTSDPELLRVVRGAVGQLATELGFSETDCRRITLAVDEALANVIRHAYGNEPGRPIEVALRRLGWGAGSDGVGRLEILLTDHGRGADPAELQGRPLDEIRPGGLGLHLIRETMDEVEYESSGGTNLLRMVKYLPLKESS